MGLQKKRDPVEGKAEQEHEEKSPAQCLADSVVTAGAVVLAHEAKGGVVPCVHGHVDEALDVYARGVAGHGQLSEGVDGGLDQHVGNRENASLQAGREADAGDSPELPQVDAELRRMEPAGVVLMREVVHHQDCRDELGEDGGVGHTLDAHAEAEHEDQVHPHVDASGEGQIVQRAPRVADGSQDSAAEVVHHHDRHAEEIDPHIFGGSADDVGGSVHEFQKGFCKGKAHGRQQNTAADAGQKGRVNGLLHVLRAVCADVAGHENVGSHGEAEKEVREQVDQRAGGSYGREGLVTHETSHHNQVRGVEEKL